MCLGHTKPDHNDKDCLNSGSTGIDTFRTYFKHTQNHFNITFQYLAAISRDNKYTGMKTFYDKSTKHIDIILLILSGLNHGEMRIWLIICL